MKFWMTALLAICKRAWYKLVSTESFPFVANFMNKGSNKFCFILIKCYPALIATKKAFLGVTCLST